MSAVPCVCVHACGENWKTSGCQSDSTDASHHQTEDIRAHARAQMLHLLRPHWTQERKDFSVLPEDGESRLGAVCGKVTPGVPHRPHASGESVGGITGCTTVHPGRAKPGWIERKGDGEENTCVWINVFFTCEPGDEGTNGCTHFLETFTPASRNGMYLVLCECLCFWTRYKMYESMHVCTIVNNTVQVQSTLQHECVYEAARMKF